MRYTHYGIGHPPVLRKLTRDCANDDLADSSGPEENMSDGDGEWMNNIRRCHDEGGEKDDSGEEDEESECGDVDDSDIEVDLDDEEMVVGEEIEFGEDTDEEDDYTMYF